MTEPTRVVFVTHSGADSGAEQSVVTYLSRWPPEVPRPRLVIGHPGPIEARARQEGVETVVVELSSSAVSTRRQERRVGQLFGAVTGLVRQSSKLRNLLRDDAVDVVVAVGVKALVSGWLAGRRAGATVVWSLHDRVHRDYFPWFVVPFLRYLAPRLVDGLLVNSVTTLRTVSRGRVPVMVTVPGIALDPRDFHEPGDQVRQVVMIGRLSPWKGQDIFLRAFARAFGGTDVEAVVVGGALFGEDDYASGLRELAVELGIADRVRFAGHVDDPWAPLVDADVMVHCSRIPEPFGQVVVQGMWARCAVVASEPGGPAEVITNGVDGLLTPCGDVGALADALIRLRKDPDLRRRLARAGRVTAEYYDATPMAPKLAVWLDQLHGRRRSASR